MLRYLSGALDVETNYKKKRDDYINTLVGYSDSDCSQDKGSRRSINGYLVLKIDHQLCGNGIIADVSCNVNIGGRQQRYMVYAALLSQAFTGEDEFRRVENPLVL